MRNSNCRCQERSQQHTRTDKISALWAGIGLGVFIAVMALWVVRYN